jgi:hypothetical protein
MLMIATVTNAVLRVIGLLCVAFAIWVLAQCFLAPILVLLMISIPTAVIGLSGFLMVLGKYRALAKLWINLIGGAMLLLAWSLPSSMGLDWRDPANDPSPWAMLASFAYFMFAVWVCQQLVLQACAIVDRRRDPGGAER